MVLLSILHSRRFCYHIRCWDLNLLQWFLIDSLGRKPLLLGSIALMTATFAAMTGLVRQIDLGAANASACGVAATVYKQHPNIADSC